MAIGVSAISELVHSAGCLNEIVPHRAKHSAMVETAFQVERTAFPALETPPIPRDVASYPMRHQLTFANLLSVKLLIFLSGHCDYPHVLHPPPAESKRFPVF
jgi:hypothetical protein